MEKQSSSPEPLLTRRNLGWLAAVGILGAVFWLLPPLAAQQDAVYRTFTPLVAVKAHIQKQYVEAVDDERLMEGAIRGMMDELDEHSQYFSPDYYPLYQEHMKGDYVGVGIVLQPDSHHMVVSTPVENSPAYQAGVRAGDLIVEISGFPVDRLTPYEAMQRLRGLAGSMAHFKVQRPPDDEIIEFSVVRREIKTRIVRGWRRGADSAWDYMIDPADQIGYIRITEFWGNTTSEFDEAIDQLRSQGVRAVVLDVRFNPGGDIQATTQVVDRFLSEGSILTTRNRYEVESSWKAQAKDTLPDWPAAVLINRESASGAEILAGALQDHHRAVVVGERSFGKGSVQSLTELSDHRSAIKLTTAYYYLPSGRCIHRRKNNVATDDWGVIPDEKIELSAEETNAMMASWFEASVVRAPGDSPSPSAIVIDRQLQRALDVLREKLRETP